MNGERAPFDLPEPARPRSPDLRDAFNGVAHPPPAERIPRHDIGDLIAAARQDDTRLVQAIINSGVDVDGKDENGDTALIVAARHGKSAAVKILMENHADPDIRSRRGSSAVMHAVIGGHAGALDALLEKGASPDATKQNDARPLEYAIQHMDIMQNGKEIFDTLMRHGANVHQLPDDKTTLVMIAAASDNDYALRALLDKKADIGGISAHGQSALTVAARNNSAKAARVLLAAGADVTHVNDQVRTASQEAAHAGFPGLAKELEAAELKYVENIMKAGTGHKTAAPKTATFKKRGDGQKPK